MNIMERMKAANSTRRPNGFTLVELLVVISIIGLLVTLVGPSLMRALRLADQTACQATLRGLGSALQLYVGEHDRKWPSMQKSTNWSLDANSGQDPQLRIECDRLVPGQEIQFAADL